MKNVFILVGFILSLFFILNMFLFFTMDDTLWLLTFPGGLLFFFIGFYIDEKQVIPLSYGQLQLKKKRLNALKSGIFFTCILLLIILSSKI